MAGLGKLPKMKAKLVRMPSKRCDFIVSSRRNLLDGFRFHSNPVPMNQFTTWIADAEL